MHPPDKVAPLLAWYRRERRDLPWRRTRDPYAIWVSEIMLQQTRVDTAIAYYERFLERFPTVKSLAGADIADVLAIWAGLGYYRRARHLHAAARVVVDSHGGVIPPDHAALRSLPGVGGYTAGAIASIAFDIAEPAIDGNVIRVFSRWLAIEANPHGGAAKKAIEEAARQCVSSSKAPGDWNQALMELGATLCTPAQPRCLLCPVAMGCQAHLLGLASKIPIAKARPATVEVERAAAVVLRASTYFFVQRPEGESLAGLYEFPTVELPDGIEPKHALAGFVRETTGLPVELGEAVADLNHTITNHRIRVRAFAATAPRTAGGRGHWLTAADARKKGLTAASRKILDRVVETQPSTKRPSDPPTN